MRVLPMILAATALALLLASGAWADPGHHGHDHGREIAYGRPGAPVKGGRVVQVTMGETGSGMVFAPNRIEVRQGEQILSPLPRRPSPERLDQSQQLVGTLPSLSVRAPKDVEIAARES